MDDTFIAGLIAIIAVIAIIKAVGRGLSHVIAVSLGLTVLLYMLKSHPRGWSILSAFQRMIGQIQYELFENWPGKKGMTTLEAESGHNITALKMEIQRLIPEAARLYQLQKDAQQSLARFYNESGIRSQYALGIGSKVEYYFNKSYIEIWAILGGKYHTGTTADKRTGPDNGAAENRMEALPQHYMVNLLNTQRKLIGVLENTVFVNSKYSDTDPDIQALMKDIKKEYSVVNRYLADWINNKTADQVNIYSGYLDYPNEPKPMNIYGNSYYHRVNKFY